MADDIYYVDIIVTVFNVEKYIAECVSSLINQSYKMTNIILVDDGSTDSSGSICDDYAKHYSNIKVIHKNNGGLVSAWKTGLSVSTSKWVNFVDGDDWIETKHIEELVKEQMQSDADVVVTRMKQITRQNEEYINFVVPSGNYKGKKLATELYPVMINAGGFEKRGVPFSRCSKLIRRELMIRNLKYLYDRATYEEDFNIIAPILMDAESISLINVENAAYCYRRVDTSMLHGYSSKMEDSVRNIYPLLYKACKDKNKELFLEQINAEYLSASVRMYTNELKSGLDYSDIRKKIESISNNNRLKNCMQNMALLRKYPIKYKLVVYALNHFGSAKEKIITKLLHAASKTIIRKS